MRDYEYIYISELTHYSRIIVVDRLTDSKNNIIKYYYLDKRAQSTHVKAQLNDLHMSI